MNAAEFQQEMLSAYLDDELDAAERQLVEERLAVDVTARQTLEELRRIRELVAALPKWDGPVAMAANEPVAHLAELDDGLPAVGAVGEEEAKTSGGSGATRVRKQHGPASWWPQLALVATLLLAVGISFALWSGALQQGDLLTFEAAPTSPAPPKSSEPMAQPMSAATSESMLAEGELAGRAMPMESQRRRGLNNELADDSMGMRSFGVESAAAESPAASAASRAAKASPAADGLAPARSSIAAMAADHAVDDEAVLTAEQVVAPKMDARQLRVAYDDASWESAQVLEQFELHPELTGIQAGAVEMAFVEQADIDQANIESAAAATDGADKATDAELASRLVERLGLSELLVRRALASDVATGRASPPGGFGQARLAPAGTAAASAENSLEPPAVAQALRSEGAEAPGSEVFGADSRLVLFVSQPQAAAIREAAGEQYRIVAELKPVAGGTESEQRLILVLSLPSGNRLDGIPLNEGGTREAGEP